MKEIERTLSKTFDGIGKIGVFPNKKHLEAVIYPDLPFLREQGILNMHEFIRLDVVEQYNLLAAPEKKIRKFTLVKKPLPKTPQGDIDRAPLASFPTEGREQTECEDIR